MKKLIVSFALLLLTSYSNAQGLISGSLNNAMAICIPDSVLWSWGYDHIAHPNPSYQTPYAVWEDSLGGELKKIVSVSTFYTHAIAALNDGRVFSWGLNAFGQLGDSLLNSNTNYPVQMKGENGNGFIDSIVEVSCGYYHSIMLKADGTVWSCGNNLFGQLGLNSTQNWSIPRQVLGFNGIGFLSDVIQIDAGSHSSVALKSDGTVWVWGMGTFGTTCSGVNEFYPVQIENIPQIVKVSIKGGHVLALDINGEIWSWGENTYGQVGDNSFSHVYSPVQVLDSSGLNVLDSISDIGTGLLHSFAIGMDGRVFAWGHNDNGQLGDGTTIDHYLPIQIAGVSGNGYLNDIVEIEGGHLLSIARKSDGSILCWGQNYTSYPEIINGFCSSLGLFENGSLQEAEITVYPNPVKSDATLVINSKNINNQINSFVLTTASGQVLQSIDTIKTSNIDVQMDGYPEGVYFISVKTEKHNTTFKFIIE